MRICGGHDYYDCALKLGMDPSIVLVRFKNETIDVDDAGGTLLARPLVLSARGLTSPYPIDLKNVAVAFCGKVYRGALGLHGEQRPQGLWAADKARTFAAQDKKRTVKVEAPLWPWRETPITLEDYFTPFDAPAPLRNYMIANKVSILVEQERSRRDDPLCFHVNPFTLKGLGFAKALDPYTAFQELSMWIGGVLGGTSPEIVAIKDDKTLIEGHGFDNRFSFRGPRI